MSDEQESQEVPLQERRGRAAAPNSLGTGSRSPSGTISLDSNLSQSHSSEEDEKMTPIDNNNNTPSVPRPRLYSEEDDELRKAKAMALAIQQNPNMTPDEIHQLHFGDEAQSQILKQQVKHKSNDHSSFLGFKSQKKKDLFSSMVGTTPSQQQQPHAAPTSPTASTAASSSLASVPESTAPPLLVVDEPPSTSKPTSPSVVKRKVAAAKARAGSGVHAAKARAGSGVRAAKDKAKTGAAAAKANLKTAKGAMISKKKQSDTVVSSSETATASLTTPSMTTLDTAAVTKSLDGEKKIRLSANVWKRRSGFGKLSYSKAWERRKVILHGSKLFYFKMEDDEEDDRQLETKDSSWFDQAAQNLEKPSWLPADNDPSAPRGFFDLYKEGTTVAASSGHSGAPSPFAISIKLKSDTYWKLCFDSHAVQMEWLAALTDAIVTASVDSYNANLLLGADPNHEATMFESEYLPPPGSRDAGTQLWMMGEYRVSSVGVNDDDHDGQETNVVETEMGIEVISTSSVLMDSDDTNADRWILDEKDVRNLLILVNAALISSRASLSNPQYFWYTLTFCNMGIGYYLVRGYKKRSTASAPAVEAAVRRSSGLVVVGNNEMKLEEEEEITGFKPKAGSTTVKLEHPEDSPMIGKQVFGAWCAPPGENLAVRSHGYLTSKEKVPSPGELYDCVNVDIFESPHRYPDMARRVELPTVEFEGVDPEIKTWYAPDVFIISVALPTDPPKMRAASNDGGGFTITMYFTMKQETRDILRRVTAEGYDPLQEPTPDNVQTSRVNAVKLFNEYCRRAPTDPSFQSRFKVVANAQNLKEIGMPSWISKYNGKPVLIKRAGQTGFLFSHPDRSCMEFDVSFHPFPYLAKHAISYMKDSFFKKVLVTFGFVIEGRSDDELPECVIGLMQLCYPDPVYAIQAKDFFAGTSPTSF